MVEIIAKSTHSEKRTRDFFKFHLLKVSPIRYVYYGIAIVLFVMSVVFYFMMKYGSSLFFLFCSLMVLLIKKVTTNMFVNKIVRKIVYPSLNYNLVFNENELIYSYDVVKKVYKWDEFKIIYEVDNYIFFYLEKNKAMILSKYILDEESRIKLKEIIINSKVIYKNKKFK